MNAFRAIAAIGLCSLALAAEAAPPFANCHDATGGEFPNGRIAITHRQFTILRDVFQRISAAARRHPFLAVCEGSSPQAAALAIPGTDGVIYVNNALVQLANGDADELAAVIGHEFGHLLHRHIEKRIAVAGALVTDLRRTPAPAAADMAAAIESVKDRFTTFSRAAEAEADDEGFSLARDAGFLPSGQRRISQKMLGLVGASGSDYLKTHPGWEKRVEYSALLERNEDYRARAAKAHRAGDAAGLREILAAWNRDVPGSAAASYYEAQRLRLAGGSAADVSAQLERAVMLYAGEHGLSQAGQRYQVESTAAGVMLCTTLYRQGQMAEAAYCARLLRTREEAELLKELTGWHGLVWVPRSRSRDERLFVGRTAPGLVTLTNCQTLAQQEALVQARRWRVAPASSASQAADGRPLMACSPDFCKCTPLEAGEMPPEGSRILREPVAE